MSEVNVVTGVSGFTGKYIAGRLLAKGIEVRNLSGHPDRPTEFGDRVQSFKLDFDNRSVTTRALEGATTLFNTYWIRFEQGSLTFARAVENTRALVESAKGAGVRRIVHVSIANPALDSPLPYYKGKAEVEEAIKSSGMSFSILRPAVIFGNEGILINNIAWFLRRLPIFAVPGSGEYKMRPIFVEDLADLAVASAEKSENEIVDAVGPETFTFNELLHLIAEVVHSKAIITHVSPEVALIGTRALGAMVHDVVLTRQEVTGLLDNLLTTDSPSTGHTRLSDWLRANADTVGAEYQSEISRHFR